MIESHISLYLTLAFLLVAGNAFFVGAEFAIVKVRASRIQEMVSSRLPGSHLAHEVVANLDQYLSACQLGVTMVSLGLGWVGEEAFTGLLLPVLQGLGSFAAPTAHALATRFADRTAGAVMVRLERVVTWSCDRPVDENLALARAEKHTRYPVYEPRRGDLVGVINLKALALYSEKDASDREGQRIEDANIVKELLRVPEDRRIDAVLKEMRRRRLHMAAVVDRQGKAIGILTMEDIIEEIFGEIEDEFESAPPAPSRGPQGQGPAAQGAR